MRSDSSARAAGTRARRCSDRTAWARRCPNGTAWARGCLDGPARAVRGPAGARAALHGPAGAQTSLQERRVGPQVHGQHCMGPWVLGQLCKRGASTEPACLGLLRDVLGIGTTSLASPVVLGQHCMGPEVFGQLCKRVRRSSDVLGIGTWKSENCRRSGGRHDTVQALGRPFHKHGHTGENRKLEKMPKNPNCYGNDQSTRQYRRAREWEALRRLSSLPPHAQKNNLERVHWDSCGTAGRTRRPSTCEQVVYLLSL